MGLINFDSIDLKSGLQLKDCYLSFTPASNVMPAPITMSWNVSPTGSKQYFANAAMYVYAGRDKKAAGCDPVETKQLMIPIDATGVFAILYASLKTQFPNNRDVPDDVTSDTQPTSSGVESGSGQSDSKDHEAPHSEP